jgi:uncharacterized protein YycO
MPPIKPPANVLYEKPTWLKQPAGPKHPHGYKQWFLPVMYDLDEVLDHFDLDGAMSDLDDLADYNFGTKKIPYDIRKGGVEWYLLNYAGLVQVNRLLCADGNVETWLWIPGNVVIEDGYGTVGPLQKKKPPPPPPRVPPRPAPDAPIRLAARSQQAGPRAVTTIDQKFRPGDILLAEHQGDVFIQQMTLTWPTHAGICLDPSKDKAVDAMPSRGDHAVAETGLNAFFHAKITPGGGLVYRYTAAANDTANREIGQKAALWAQAQIGHKYHFTLRSPILGEERDKKDKFKVEDHHFDAQGEATDETGLPLMIDTKSRGPIHRLHDIYCAELVWRAYRFGAGIVLVDPKMFFCLYDHPNRAVVGLMSFQIGSEARTYISGDVIPGSSPTLESIKRHFSGGWAHLLTNRLARHFALKKMRAKHNGYLCAPHQFLQSPVLQKVRRITPDKSLVKHKVYNFHQADVHPLDVALNREKGEKLFQDWCKTKGKPCETSVDAPLNLQAAP